MVVGHPGAGPSPVFRAGGTWSQPLGHRHLWPPQIPVCTLTPALLCWMTRYHWAQGWTLGSFSCWSTRFIRGLGTEGLVGSLRTGSILSVHSPRETQALLGETQRVPGAAWCGLRVPTAGRQAGRGPSCRRLRACSSPGRRLARLGPCRVPYTLLVKGSSVICGARMGGACHPDGVVPPSPEEHRNAVPRSKGFFLSEGEDIGKRIKSWFEKDCQRWCHLGVKRRLRNPSAPFHAVAQGGARPVVSSLHPPGTVSGVSAWL